MEIIRRPNDPLRDDPEPTAADLDLTQDPDLEAIADPSEIDGAPEPSDLSDPDLAGEIDPDQTIDVSDDAADANDETNTDTEGDAA